jgi:hypothetical protein
MNTNSTLNSDKCSVQHTKNIAATAGVNRLTAIDILLTLLVTIVVLGLVGNGVNAYLLRKSFDYGCFSARIRQ